MTDVLLYLLLRDEEFQGVIESDGRQAPHPMLPVTKHRKGVTVLVTCAEMCVATILGVTQVGHGQGENLLHLGQIMKRIDSVVMYRYFLQFKLAII